MKHMKGLLAAFLLGLLSLPYRIAAQDAGTYIDNLNVQDSSYMEQDLLAESGNGGSNTTIIIIVAVVVVAVVAFFLLRKKKK